MAKGSISALLVTLCLTWPAANALAADDRMAVMLNDEQKSFVLGHMRDMLEALTDTQQLLLEGKREELRQRIANLQSREQANRLKGWANKYRQHFVLWRKVCDLTGRQFKTRT